jgi:hypothetical protein
MRPEEFDKRFQEKLDEFNPVFNEQDWIRLSEKMKRRNSSGFFTRRNGLILLLLFSLLMGTWMTMNWPSIWPDTDKPNRDIKTEQSIPIADVLESKSDNASDEITESSTLGKKVNSHEVNSSLTKAESPSLNSLKSNNNIQSSEKSFSKKFKKQNTSNQFAAGPSMPINNEKELIAEEKVTTNTSHELGLKSVTKENELVQQSQAANHPNKNEDNEGELRESISSVEGMEVLDLSGLNLPERQHLKFKLLKGWKPNKWIIGVTALGTANHVNTGLAFEMKTNKNISFGSGLVMQNYHTQNYLNEIEFSEETDAEFTELIKPRYSKSISFSNIQIKSMDILVPLTLKYYIPLDIKYSLFFNAGVQLTMYSKTSLTFDYLNYDPPTSGIENDFDQPSNSATLINHFSLGAGIQRDFGKAIFQMGFSYQKNNSNQPQISKQELAGQVGIFYKL